MEKVPRGEFAQPTSTQAVPKLPFLLDSLREWPMKTLQFIRNILINMKTIESVQILMLL